MLRLLLLLLLPLCVDGLVTGRFHLPLVQIVGVNSNRKSVLVAAALVQAEGLEDYEFVVEGLKEAIGEDIAPETVVTDGNIAVHSVLKRHYPQTQLTLCQWHLRTWRTYALACLPPQSCPIACSVLSLSCIVLLPVPCGRMAVWGEEQSMEASKLTGTFATCVCVCME